MNGVADFLEYTATAPKRVDVSGYVSALIAALGLAETSEMRRTVSEIFQRSFRTTSDSSHSAEINCVLDRFGLADGSTASASGLTPETPIAFANKDLRAVFERHYVEPVLAAGTIVYRNVRLTNAGLHPWSSRTQPPAFLSYHWLLPSGVSVIYEGRRTAFAIDVEPGRSISIPLEIETPCLPGDYILQVAIVHEGIAWCDDDALAIPVRIGSGTPEASRVVPHVSGLSLDYANDHALGAELVRELIESENDDRPQLLLEVGGATHPQLAAFRERHSIVNIDVSAPLLELGVLFFARAAAASNLAFICCDAAHPPFTPGVFDGIAMFSALHHFAEPERLLTSLRLLLKPGGFIAVMCEPVREELSGPETVRDLQSGINEQVFSIEEYLSIATQAGMTPSSVRLDGGSLKLILREK